MKINLPDKEKLALVQVRPGLWAVPEAYGASQDSFAKSTVYRAKRLQKRPRSFGLKIDLSDRFLEVDDIRIETEMRQPYRGHGEIPED